ncbi:MAG: hypothetical protein PHP50_12055 [Lachnospiraceae bacterium]|nr:hypothetical protein [Lachnospiraceae bacterium]
MSKIIAEVTRKPRENTVDHLKQEGEKDTAVRLIVDYAFKESKAFFECF